MKDVAQEQYSHHEAERGAGRSIESLPPAHPKASKSAQMEEGLEVDDEMSEESSEADQSDNDE